MKKLRASDNISGKFLAKLLDQFDIPDPPDSLKPLDDSTFQEVTHGLIFREIVSPEYLGELGVEKPVELLNQIHQDMEKLIPGRNAKLENRNLVAVGGNAISILFEEWILKYPLDQYFKPILQAEAERHKRAYDLYHQWIADPNNHKLSFDPQIKFKIPQWQWGEGGYRIEYVGRSLDILAIEALIQDIEPDFENRLRNLAPQIRFRQLTPAEVHLLLNHLLYFNIPSLKEEGVFKNEMLSALSSAAPHCLTHDHYDALVSFLEYAYRNGFVYLDKMIDNATLDYGGQLHLIDYGLAKTFDPHQPPFTIEDYRRKRVELVVQSIEPFLRAALYSRRSEDL